MIVVSDDFYRQEYDRDWNQYEKFIVDNNVIINNDLEVDFCGKTLLYGPARELFPEM